MRKDKIQALEMRQRGYSYKAIQRELGIPIGTLSGWFKKEPWSASIRDQLAKSVSLAHTENLSRMRQANSARWALWRQGCRDEGTEDFLELQKHPLFLAGVSLYWSEGDHSTKTSIVRLSSSDPQKIRIFYKLLTSLLTIAPERIAANLMIYPDLIEGVQKKFWAAATGLPASSFKRSYILQRKGSAKRSAYGVCVLQINSRKLKEKFLRWIEMYPEHLSA